MELASLAQLDRSHRRHDDVMEQLLAAARRLAAGRPDTGDVDSVREAVEYFQRAVPRHFLDEEGSVFPRLSTRRPDLADALAQLSAEHPQQIGLQQAIASAARELADDSRQGAGKQLLELAERLAALHHAHVAREDSLFADAVSSLTTEDDTEIVAEMAMRRERDGDGRGARGGGGGGGGGGGAGRGGGRRRQAAVSTKHAPKPAKKPAVKRAAKTAKKPVKRAAKAAAKTKAAKKPRR